DPLLEAIAIGRAVRVGDVDGLWWAALDRFDLHAGAPERTVGEHRGDRGSGDDGLGLHSGSYLPADFSISSAISRRSAASRTRAASSSWASRCCLPARRACAFRAAMLSFSALHVA